MRQWRWLAEGGERGGGGVAARHRSQLRVRADRLRNDHRLGLKPTGQCRSWSVVLVVLVLVNMAVNVVVAVDVDGAPVKAGSRK
jgi:hypothetical protein